MALSHLEAAHAAALDQSADDNFDEGVLTCPKKEEKSVIHVQVVGEDDQGLEGVRVVLRNASGQELRRKTDTQGLSIMTGLDKTSYTLSLIELDKDAWEVIEEEKIKGKAAKSGGTAAWQSPQAASPDPGLTHAIVQGECIAKIAEQYGFFPETIWAQAENRELREKRKTMYILAPDDRVFIPAKRLAEVTANYATLIKIRRKGVPERLRIRFLDYEDTPRAGIPYLLSVTTEKDEVLPDKTGKTDAKGFVDESIPPGAVKAKIVLGEGDEQETHTFDLGHVDPLDSASGVQARLNNLGYDCGDEEGEWGEETQNALRAFQREKELEETGALNPATEQALFELACS